MDSENERKLAKFNEGVERRVKRWPTREEAIRQHAKVVRPMYESDNPYWDKK
jgi:hypothetical protein